MDGQVVVVSRGQFRRYLIGGELYATWLGVAIIVSSGMYVFHREATLARQAKRQ